MRAVLVMPAALVLSAREPTVPVSYTHLQKDAAETRDVKPAKLGEDIQRVVRVGLIDRNAPLNGIDLPGKALIREARAPAGHALHRLAQQYRRHRAGGGGVANAHLARGQQGDALRFLLRCV